MSHILVSSVNYPEGDRFPRLRYRYSAPGGKDLSPFQLRSSCLNLNNLRVGTPPGGYFRVFELSSGVPTLQKTVC
ncbi:hypothetical protein NJ959_16205 [Symplocastrum sp. BBK-W-15]|uniref:Uncharacterized protein n=1 Tax=Limnofasciculus baicalensis BBK-W-15 TaxID=2699891 RepID=A0AAE3KSZ1_9CYAN|nr:hypothetical protein [Limnofasciculus baicalensis BBK-W-15]